MDVIGADRPGGQELHDDHYLGGPDHAAVAALTQPGSTRDDDQIRPTNGARSISRGELEVDVHVEDDLDAVRQVRP